MRRYLVIAAVLAFVIATVSRAYDFELARGALSEPGDFSLADGDAHRFVAAPKRRVTPGSESAIPPTATQHQGHRLAWWVKRARQNKRDALARGRTIRRLQRTANQRLQYPTGHWLDGAFLCIHSHERGAAGWQTETGNGYYGGLQMDQEFVHSHTPRWVLRAFGWNPARWPASVQITVAINAWTTRGFSPWPNTRRMCGI